ncbi:hypothetical protein Tco_1276788 [Tanacetum coccineum]
MNTDGRWSQIQTASLETHSRLERLLILATDQTGRRFSEVDIDSSQSACSAHEPCFRKDSWNLSKQACSSVGANLYGARAHRVQAPGPSRLEFKLVA